MLYFKFAALWITFLESLGVQVRLSESTNKRIMEEGIKLAVDETCLPVKIFLGHVAKLGEQVDCVFMPRVESVRKEEWLCAKFLGLNDICRNLFDGIRLLEFNMCPAQEGISQWRAFFHLGWQLSGNGWRILQAYRSALAAQRRYEGWIKLGFYPEQALKRAQQKERPPARPSAPAKPMKNSQASLRIALLGHAYVMYDNFIGMPILQKLQQMEVEVLTMEQVDKATALQLSKCVSSTNYWTFNKEILGAAQYYRQLGVDGIIFLMAFPCGPDALSMDVAARKLKKQLPIMTLVLDELQAEGGVQTRLESFIDVLRMRREAAHAHSA